MTIRNLRKNNRILIIPDENYIIESLPMAYSIFSQMDGARIYYYVPEKSERLFNKLAWVDKVFIYKDTDAKENNEEFLKYISFQYTFYLMAYEKFKQNKLAIKSEKTIFIPRKRKFFFSMKSAMHSAYYYQYLTLLKNIGLTKKYYLAPVIGYQSIQFVSNKNQEEKISFEEEDEKKNDPLKILWIIDRNFIENTKILNYLFKHVKEYQNTFLTVGFDIKDQNLKKILSRKKLHEKLFVNDMDDSLDEIMKIISFNDLIISWDNYLLHISSLLQKLHFGLYDENTSIHENRTLPLENHSLYYADYLVHATTTNQKKIAEKLDSVLSYILS